MVNFVGSCYRRCSVHTRRTTNSAAAPSIRWKSATNQYTPVPGTPVYKEMKEQKQPSAILESVLATVDGEILKGSSLRNLVGTLEASKTAIYGCLLDHFHSETAAKAVTLKVLNLCLARYHSAARSDVVLSKPFGLIADTTNSCHLSCPGCVHSGDVRRRGLFDWKPGLLSPDRLTAFLRRYGACAIQSMFYSYGEPLLNPRTPEFIRQAKCYLVQTMLSSSMSVPHFDAEAYVLSGLDYMIASVDGASQPVYERFRKQGNIGVVYRNISKVVSAKRALGRQTPVISWHYLAFEHNVHEIPLARKIACQLGCDQFRVVTPDDVSWDDPAIRAATIAPTTTDFNSKSEQALLDNWHPFPNGLDSETISAEFAAGWSNRLNSTPQPPGQTCRWLYKNMAMDANGRIFPCSGAPGTGINLVYAQFDGNNRLEPFHSDQYQLARLFFADKQSYEQERIARGLPTEPHCVNCAWQDMPCDIDSPQIAHYLKAAGPGLFNARSTSILSGW